ncbi:MAG: CHAT domain-containing protein [Sphaerospermopsis sp. SIO1G2]|nr:CHAT domain-containing protein [Sphaerospermopsis sp. SIO1G2]
MKKQVIINIKEKEDEGFRTTIQQVVGNTKYTLIKCDFPQNLSISDCYQEWQTNYDALINFSRTRTGFKNKQVTNVRVSVPECNQKSEALRESLNHWLNPVKEQLEQALDINPEDEINVIIQTENISSESTQNILQKLPWHWWDFFNRDNFTDVAISFGNLEQVSSISSGSASVGSPSVLLKPKRVKILCVLGDSRDIDVEADRRFIRKIPGAYCVFLRQPTKAEFLDFMLRERWDILFFSGHSETDEDANTGLLYLNSEETLDIQEAKETIEKAIEQYQGIKLAIFNSCDGLGLARQLAGSDIAQIIVWREPVPDKVAQEFLKSFLNNFTNLEEFPGGLSLYRSVQKARLEVQEYINENDNFPKISWLPVIHHNLEKESVTWKQLRQLPDTIIQSHKKSPREVLLDRVEEFWIKGVLEKSLHINEKETIELGISECFDAVTYPAIRQGENTPQQHQDLPEGTRAIDIFGELENRKTMLILGEPGSGKTTALLEIADESIIDTRKDRTLPIPVVLNLSSWAGDRQPKPLAKWLEIELNRIYQFSKKQCQHWVKNQNLLLLLDGLDEVIESKRDACIRAINQFLREYAGTEIVVCCRMKEYNKISERLHFQSAIFYKSPTEAQINRYFDDAGEELLAVKKLKQEDKAIQELVKNPLTLNLIAVAYKHKSKEELLNINSLEKRRNHLFETYLQKKIEEEQQLEYPLIKSNYWLSWLAQTMMQTSQQVLLIEQIQPDWLETNTQKFIYSVGFRLILGLIAGFILVLHFGTQVTDDLGVQISLFIPSLIAALVSCLSSLVLSSFISKILPRFIPEHISRFIAGMISGLIYLGLAAPWVYAIVEQSKLWREVLSPLIIDGVALGIFLSLIDQKVGIIDTIDKSWKKAMKYSLVGLFSGSIYVFWRLFFTDRYVPAGNLYELTSDNLFDISIELLIFTNLPGLIGFLDKGENLEQTIIPNQGVWRSAKNAARFFIICFPVGMLCSWNYSDGGIHEIISIGLAVGLLAGMAGGKGPVLAGMVLIQHFTLRVILWWDCYIPWNYSRFLDYATKRIFLRKVGGGYIFIHRMLMEHFAQMRF